MTAQLALSAFESKAAKGDPKPFIGAMKRRSRTLAEGMRPALDLYQPLSEIVIEKAI